MSERNLEEFFGKKIVQDLRGEGYCGMVPISRLCELEDIKSLAPNKGFDIEESRWGSITYISLIPKSSGSPLVVYLKRENKEKAQPYVLDKDLERFREIFGGSER